MTRIIHFRTASDHIFDYVHIMRSKGGYPLLETIWHSFRFESAPRPNDMDDWMVQ